MTAIDYLISSFIGAGFFAFVFALCVIWGNQQPPEISYMGDPAIYTFIKNGG
jgi:hypothetical protein